MYKNNVISVTVPNVTGVPTRCTKRHMYQNAPTVEKRTRRDRSRCDESQGEKSKISARTLERCGLENSKNTKNAFLDRGENFKVRTSV